jgi:hypothetical protein
MEIWNPRWPRIIQRTFGQRSSGPMNVVEDLLPVLSLVDETANEHHFERGEFPFSVYGNVPAVALNYAVFAISISTAGWLLVIEQILIGGASAPTIVTGGFAYTGIGAPISASFGITDGRYVSRGMDMPAYVTFQSNAAAAPGTQVLGDYIPATSSMIPVVTGESAIILYKDATSTTGGVFQMAAATANVGFDCQMHGYLRPLDTGEANL